MLLSNSVQCILIKKKKNQTNQRIAHLCFLLLYQKAVKWVNGASGELAAEITKHVDLSGAWKREQDKLWRSQQRTQYHVQPLQNPDGVKWPLGIVQAVSVGHARKIFMSWRPNSVSVLSAKAEKQQYYISPSLYSETPEKLLSMGVISPSVDCETVFSWCGTEGFSKRCLMVAVWASAWKRCWWWKNYLFCTWQERLWF